MCKKRCIRWFLLVLLLGIVSVGSLSVEAYGYAGVDVQKEASLTISFETENMGYEGMHFRVYRVAELSNTANFILSKDFEGTSISLQSLTKEQWEILPQQLTDYITRTKAVITPLAEGKTDNNGVASFTNLTTGLYLVVGEQLDLESRVYTPIPFLVQLPGLNGEKQWEYHRNAVVKYTLTTVEEPEPLPPTGEGQMVISFLLLGSSVVTFLILCIGKKSLSLQ